MPFILDSIPEHDIDKLNFINSVFKVDSNKIKKYMSNTKDFSKDLNTIVEISHSLFNYRDSIQELILTTNHTHKYLVVKLKVSRSIMLKQFNAIRFFVEFVDEK